MSTTNVDLLQDVLEVAIDSEAFYVAAVQAVENPILRDQFKRMAAAKRDLIDKLSRHIKARSENPDTGGTIAGSLRKAYAEVLVALGSQDSASYTYTAQLEQSEDRLLKHFKEALAATDSAEIRATLEQQLPKMQACHDEMRNLKVALAA